MRCPAAIPAAALCTGIVAGIFVCPDSAYRFSALLAAVFLIAAGAAFALHRAPETLVFITSGFVSAGVALGGVADSEARRTPLVEIFDSVAGTDELHVFAHIEGRLRSDATPGPSGITLDVHIDRLTVGGFTWATSGGALVGVGGVPGTDRVLQWRAGRRISLPATLRRPTRYLNPGVPDAVRSLAWRRTSLVGSAKSDRLVDVTAAGDAPSEMSAFVRSRVRDAIGHTVAPWSSRSAAVVTAILIGDRAGLHDEVERRLQDAGTYHVIAISGGNIAILAGLCLAVFRVVNAGVRLSALLVIVMLACYAAIVEGGPSVGRAALMASVYFAARVFDQRTQPTNAACLTAAILICLDPLRIVDPGLALTFGATLGIVIGMSRLADVLPTPKWMRVLAVLFAASLCAEIALLPIGAFVFSRISFAGLVVNFAAIPLMTIAQLAGMCAVALTWLSVDAAPATGWIAHMAVEGLVGSAGIVDVMPWLALRVAPPPLLVVFLYYTGVAVVLMQSAAPSGVVRRAAIVAVMCCAGWIVTAPSIDISRLGKTVPLRVTFLDVGQGDAAIVQFPDGKTLSVDAGGLASGTFDIATRVVSPTLWAIGVRRLDYLTFTHGDVDHIGGAAGLFRDFKPPEVWEGVPVPPHIPTQELRALADATGTPWRTVHRFDRLAFGAVDLIVHHPSRPDWERQRIRNDDSEVIELRYGRVSFVFTGDIGRDTERAIASGFDPAAIRVLKVPHHGSATSSSVEFLDALRPDIAVISAGRGNPFGHPVRSVLERYRSIGAAIYRTDQDGAVTVETDGTTVKVRTFNGRQLTLTTNGR